jgi:hypothetical protein
VVQQLGAGLGALAGLIAGRWGLPPTASTIVGTPLGNTLSVAGKGLTNTILDRHTKTRTGGDDTGNSRGSGSGQPMTGVRSHYAGHRGMDGVRVNNIIRRSAKRSGSGNASAGS